AQRTRSRGPSSAWARLAVCPRFAGALPGASFGLGYSRSQAPLCSVLGCSVFFTSFFLNLRLRRPTDCSHSCFCFVQTSSELHTRAPEQSMKCAQSRVVILCVAALNTIGLAFGGSRSAHQTAPDDSAVLGDWRGESICVVRESACHDEDSLYHATKSVEKPGWVSMKLDKI